MRRAVPCLVAALGAVLAGIGIALFARADRPPVDRGSADAPRQPTGCSAWSAPCSSSRASLSC
jgi:hypothetical protein